MQGLALASKYKTTASRPMNYGRATFLLREIEKKAGNGATGATIVKMVSKPIARLIEGHEIGPEEVQAASDIFSAFMSITGNLWIGPQSWERRDRAYHSAEAAAVIDAQRRYKNWADHWSMMAKRGDKTLQVVVAAVVDERPFYQIEADLGIRHGLAKRATVRGLRDYAARAGWCKPQQAAAWKAEAGSTFRAVHPIRSLAEAAFRALKGDG